MRSDIAKPPAGRHRLLLARLALACACWMAIPAQAIDSLQAFLLAARANNDSAFVFRMPGLGLDLKTQDELKNNLLMMAIREGGDKIALALLRQPAWQSKAVLEQENQLSETALMLAALKGADQVARRLIQLGAQVNRPGWTALHYAATSGSTDLIRLLAENNAFLDAASPSGATPLMMAARFNHRNAANLLLELGADPTLTNDVGMTARDYAKGNQNKNLEFWIQLGEASFISRYLTGTLKVDTNDSLTDAVQKSGGTVKLKPGQAAATQKGPLQPVDDSTPGPAKVEVFKGIR